jgi:hypothetical protein
VITVLLQEYNGRGSLGGATYVSGLVATFVAALCNLLRWPLQLTLLSEVIAALGDDVTSARANNLH